MSIRHGWSLDKNEWQQLEHQLMNTKWDSTPFRQDNVNSVPASPGVYILTTSPQALQHIVSNSKVDLIGFLYVGETADLKKRFLDHLRAKKESGSPGRNIAQCKETFPRLEFHWTSFDSREDGSLTFITRLERSLIHILSPPANTQRPRSIQAKCGTQTDVPTHN